jgi:hypothetical protein
MKKMKFLYGFLAIVMLGFLTSCEEEGEAVGPELLLDGTSNYVAADKSLQAGSAFKVLINAKAGDADLVSFKASRVFDNKPETIVDSTLTKDSESSFSITLNLKASTSIGTENFIFTVTDKDGLKTEKSFVITTTRTPGAIDKFTAVLMGAQTANPGSFLDAETGNVYKMTEKDAKQGVIDIIFYYGISSGNQCTFVAPTHSTVNGTTTTDFSWCKDWATKNATKYKSNIGITTADFDAIENDEKLFAVDNISDEIITKLQVNDVAAFKTANEKIGVFKVVSITGKDGASEITIDVKIQK